jgi:hypothetical protein
MSNKIKRRKFIKCMAGGGLTAAHCPVGSLLSVMVDSLIAKAEASVGGSNPRAFVHINFEGGLFRWNWDNPMQPKDSDPYLPNPMVATRFNGVDEAAGTFSLEYATTTIGQYKMPWIWTASLPTTGGGTAPMSDLLDNMLTIRGVNMETDNHGGDNAKMVAPVTGGASLTGIVADASTYNIPAVTVGDFDLVQNASQAYNAPNKTGRIHVFNDSGGPSNYAEYILKSFKQDVTKSFRDTSYVKAKIDSAIDALQQHAKNNEHLTDPIFRDRKSAEDLFRAGISSMGSGDFDTLVAKYSDLVRRAITDKSTVGISDKKLGGIKFPFSYAGEDKKILSDTLTDSDPYANQFNFEGHLVGNNDLRSMFESAHMDLMVKNFALAEFLLKNKLSHSITLMHSFGAMANLSIDNSPEVTNSVEVTGVTATNSGGDTLFTVDADALKSSAKDLNIDTHQTGSATGLLISSMFYMAVSSCLLEFINSLKGTPFSSDPADERTLFDETVIQIASEFERKPRISGRGSEHGWEGNTTSYFSGCIKGHKIIGNIWDQTNWDTDFPGTWGEGAPVDGVGGAAESNLLLPGHLTSTAATLLRVAPPTTAQESLVSINTNGDIDVALGIEQPARNKARP